MPPHNPAVILNEVKDLSVMPRTDATRRDPSTSVGMTGGGVGMTERLVGMIGWRVEIAGLQRLRASGG
jgi:hypothetical protein